MGENEAARTVVSRGETRGAMGGYKELRREVKLVAGRVRWRFGSSLTTTMRFTFLRVLLFTFAAFLPGLTGNLRAQMPTPWRASSEAPFDFDADRVWRGSVPNPSQILGYDVGEAYADYGSFLRLLERYADSERVLVRKTGHTNERRPMLFGHNRHVQPQPRGV